MMGLTLADAVPLRAVIQQRIKDDVVARNRIAVATVAKGETPEAPAVTVDTYTARIAEARQDFRTLDRLMAEANLRTTLEWDGQTLSLLEAIQLAKDLRQAIVEYKALGAHPRVTRAKTGGFLREATELLEVAQYDPVWYQQEAERLMRRVVRLSRVIDRINETVAIDFPAARKYMMLDDDGD
ncbi:hypothetical protein [Sulfobacillus thermosulfidooxidans]|uniref:hypothetical protein n=1 Tax=Sulfobacillus thermosulfidooxidans TaxID=28034 RepID=UPI000C1FC355|nr:hypothetical protein [Sulfobacillus thermosulfidooxidans]